MSQSRSARFRERLRKPPFVCLGAHDAVTAKLAEQAGAPAIYVSGFVASAIIAGQPDFGMVRSGKSPYLSLEEAYELAFDYTLSPVEPMLAMHKAVKEMMETFMSAGCTTNAIADRLTPFEEFNDFIGLPERIARAKRFGA